VEVGDLLPKAKWGQSVAAAQRQVSAITRRSVVRFDSRSQQLVVEVSPSTRPSDASIAASVRDALPGTAVVVRRTPMTYREVEDDTMRGGGFLETTTGTPICTAGFVIRGISSGLKRLSTAAHCIQDLGGLNGTARYELLPPDGGNATPITLMWKVPGSPSPSLPDLGYTSHGSFTPFPSFYITNFDKREVHTAAQSRADVGTLLCHWGRSTHAQECGHVTDSVANVNEACCVTLVNGNEAAHLGGDSGGPWYYGFMAFGIHHGGAPNSTDASFTPVHMLNDFAAGWEIWTTG
jgi:streptogrisin C